MKQYILTSIMITLLFGQAFFFGVSDFFVIIFVCFTAVFLYLTLIKLQESNRRTLLPSTRPGSWLHDFLSRDTTFLMRVVTLFSSLILSSILIVLIKGMVLQQGYWAFFVVITLSSLFIYSFVNTKISNKKIDENIHPEITQHGNELARIFYAAIILNLVLSFAFSANDTFSFKTSDVNFDNFTDKVKEQSYERTDSNQYGRIFINAYLIMDNVKIALAKKFVELFNLKDNFYGFYLTILALNTFKLFAFSFSFVLLQRGFDRAATALVPFVTTTLAKPTELFRNYRQINPFNAKNQESKES